MSFFDSKTMFLWRLKKGNWRGWQFQSWFVCQGESFQHDSQYCLQLEDIVSAPTDGVASTPQADEASASGVLRRAHTVLMDSLNIPFTGMYQ